MAEGSDCKVRGDEIDDKIKQETLIDVLETSSGLTADGSAGYTIAETSKDADNVVLSSLKSPQTTKRISTSPLKELPPNQQMQDLEQIDNPLTTTSQPCGISSSNTSEQEILCESQVLAKTSFPLPAECITEENRGLSPQKTANVGKDQSGSPGKRKFTDTITFQESTSLAVGESKFSETAIKDELVYSIADVHDSMNVHSQTLSHSTSSTSDSVHESIPLDSEAHAGNVKEVSGENCLTDGKIISKSLGETGNLSSVETVKDDEAIRIRKALGDLLIKTIIAQSAKEPNLKADEFQGKDDFTVGEAENLEHPQQKLGQPVVFEDYNITMLNEAKTTCTSDSLQITKDDELEFHPPEIASEDCTLIKTSMLRNLEDSTDLDSIKAAGSRSVSGYTQTTNDRVIKSSEEKDSVYEICKDTIAKLINNIVYNEPVLESSPNSVKSSETKVGETTDKYFNIHDKDYRRSRKDFIDKVTVNNLASTMICDSGDLVLQPAQAFGTCVDSTGFDFGKEVSIQRVLNTAVDGSLHEPDTYGLCLSILDDLLYKYVVPHTSIKCLCRGIVDEMIDKLILGDSPNQAAERSGVAVTPSAQGDRATSEDPRRDCDTASRESASTPGITNTPRPLFCHCCRKLFFGFVAGHMETHRKSVPNWSDANAIVDISSIGKLGSISYNLMGSVVYDTTKTDHYNLELKDLTDFISNDVKEMPKNTITDLMKQHASMDQYFQYASDIHKLSPLFRGAEPISICETSSVQCKSGNASSLRIVRQAQFNRCCVGVLCDVIEEGNSYEEYIYAFCFISEKVFKCTPRKIRGLDATIESLLPVEVVGRDEVAHQQYHWIMCLENMGDNRMELVVYVNEKRNPIEINPSLLRSACQLRRVSGSQGKRAYTVLCHSKEARIVNIFVLQGFTATTTARVNLDQIEAVNSIYIDEFSVGMEFTDSPPSTKLAILFLDRVRSILLLVSSDGRVRNRYVHDQPRIFSGCSVFAKEVFMCDRIGGRVYRLSMSSFKVQLVLQNLDRPFICDRYMDSDILHVLNEDSQIKSYTLQHPELYT